MDELRKKIINVLKSLVRYYRNLGDDYDAISEEIEKLLKTLPHYKDPVNFLESVENYRKQLNSLEIIPSKLEYERIRLLLDRLISIIRMKHLLKMLKDYADDENEDEDDPVATLRKYTLDDDVYVT
jgi:hypothetical protein